MTETETRGPLFGLQERQPTAEEKKIMDSILQLCRLSVSFIWKSTDTNVCILTVADQLNPVSSAYALYDQKAIFHDPITKAQGLKEVEAQFK